MLLIPPGSVDIARGKSMFSVNTNFEASELLKMTDGDRTTCGSSQSASPHNPETLVVALGGRYKVGAVRISPATHSVTTIDTTGTARTISVS